MKWRANIKATYTETHTCNENIKKKQAQTTEEMEITLLYKMIAKFCLKNVKKYPNIIF